MNEIISKNKDFIIIYNKSYRLAAAVFVISNLMDQSEELRSKIKSLSLKLVSIVVHLKDANSFDVKTITVDLEKNTLELMSFLDIASVSGLISKMNGDIIKQEFQSFIIELGKFAENFSANKNTVIDGIFSESLIVDSSNSLGKGSGLISKNFEEKPQKEEHLNMIEIDKSKIENFKNGHKRKDLRKSTVLEFIKGHDMVSIKDIMPNVNGCSEKTVQRELISLINERKIKKVGERRWSRYSIV